MALEEHKIYRDSGLALGQQLKSGATLEFESSRIWNGGNHTSIALQDPNRNSEVPFFVSFQPAEDRILLNSSRGGPNNNWGTEILIPNLRTFFPPGTRTNAIFIVEYNNKYYNIKIDGHYVGGMEERWDGAQVAAIYYDSDGDPALSTFSDPVKVTVYN